MSQVSFVSSSNINLASSEQTFMVGNPRIAQKFSELMRKHGSTTAVETDPLVERDIDLVFGRDSRIIGLDRAHLFPYPIQDSLLEGHFKALLPSSANSFVENTMRKGFGEGFSNDNVKAALSYAKKHNLPYRQMLSSLEGGNVYVFFDLSHQTKAIVGIHSLVLTVIGLEEQGYFETNQEILQEISAGIEDPSDDAVRAARNITLYHAKKDFDGRLNAFREQKRKMDFMKSVELQASLTEELRKTWGSEIAYRQLLTAPVSKENRAQYFYQACEWEAKLILARRVIAEDLNVSVENIAFVSQKQFHIDMEMFIAPNGYDVYVDEASSKISVEEALEKIGCNVVSLPGVHKVSNESINFMNGVFVSTPTGHVFITNGVQRKHSQLLSLFQRALLNTNPGFQVDFLDETMQDILTNNGGGIHCLTWEKFTV